MSRKIGIFNMQEQVIEAVQALESSGFDQEHLKVIAKDREHSQRVESETDVHADEALELADRGNDGRGAVGSKRIGLFGLAGFGNAGSAGFAGGSGFTGVQPVAPALGVGLYALGRNDGLGVDGGEPGVDADITGALRSLGLTDSEADACTAPIEGGSLVLIAEADDSEAADGQGASLLAAAEETFRRCGAEQVL